MLCSVFFKTRCAYYKHQKLFEKRQQEAREALRFIRKVRCRQPRIGTRKLHRLLPQAGIPIGRDRLFELLKNHDSLIRNKRNYARTTYSKHGFQSYRNLVKSYCLTGPNQVYVADITYLRTLEGFLYLFLITDLYSRKIVGYHVAENLGVDEAIRAQEMALKQCPNPQGLIHHSDRGLQYCAYDYTDKLKERGVKISMTEENHVYENATAERVNGILKSEFFLGKTLKTKVIALKMTIQAIAIYNKERPHLSLDYKTPDQVHAA